MAAGLDRRSWAWGRCRDIGLKEFDLTVVDVVDEIDVGAFRFEIFWDLWFVCMSSVKSPWKTIRRNLPTLHGYRILRLAAVLNGRLISLRLSVFTQLNHGFGCELENTETGTWDFECECGVGGVKLLDWRRNLHGTNKCDRFLSPRTKPHASLSASAWFWIGSSTNDPN